MELMVNAHVSMVGAQRIVQKKAAQMSVVIMASVLLTRIPKVHNASVMILMRVPIALYKYAPNDAQVMESVTSRLTQALSHACAKPLLVDLVVTY